MSVVLFCYILDVMLCYVMCEKKIKNVDNKKKEITCCRVNKINNIRLFSLFNKRTRYRPVL